jgi:hypothetical protein
MDAGIWKMGELTLQLNTCRALLPSRQRTFALTNDQGVGLYLRGGRADGGAVFC